MFSFLLASGGDHISRLDSMGCITGWIFLIATSDAVDWIDYWQALSKQFSRSICRIYEKSKRARNPIYDQFLGIFNNGVELVKKCKKTSCFNVFQNLRYASQVQQTEKEILGFAHYLMPVQLILDVKNLITELKGLHHLYELGSVDERKVNEAIVPKLTSDPQENAMLLQQMGSDDILDGAFDKALSRSYSCSVKSDFVVGLENNIWNLKRILLHREASVVGVHGIGSVGKTATALVLADDQEIKGALQNNIIFFTVSQSPKVKVILETMWEKIVHRKTPKFQSVEDAHRQLLQLLLRQAKPTLVVLDDVCSRANLENLLFEREGYRTLVTTRVRFTIPTTTSTWTYELPLLDEADAVYLFCIWGFIHKSVLSNAYEHLDKQVIAEMRRISTVAGLLDYRRVTKSKEEWSWFKSWSDEFRNCLRKLIDTTVPYHFRKLQLVATEDGNLESILRRVESPSLIWLHSNNCPYCSLPSWIPMKNIRVLEVVGNKFKTLWRAESQVQAECKGLPLTPNKPRQVWEIAKNKLLNGESISEYQKEGLLNCLQTSIDFLDDEAGQCFFDLGSFPEDSKISVDALMDIRVYVRKMDWKDPFLILLELASRNLLKLTSNLRSQAINYGSASELYFSLQDVMRNLALYLASRDKIVNGKRLLIPKRDSLSGKWELLKDQVFDAQIVSIQTGVMEEDQGSEVNFHQAKALVINFSASNYFLPTFLRSMKKLKVLMVINYGFKRATVNDLPALSSLTQLRTICLESLNVPSLQKHSLSLSLCEGLGHMSRVNSTQSSLKFPIMLDFNVDHCCDLEELPLGTCGTCSVENWSITNCHFLQELPDDMEKLSNVKVICMSRPELTASIGKVGNLEYLDISLCECLKELPGEIGQLKKFQVLDLRECSRLSRGNRTTKATSGST